MRPPVPEQNQIYSSMLRAATIGPAIPKVTPNALAALLSELVALAAAPVPVVVEPPAEEVASTPDLVTANVCDWLMMPLLVPTLPMKLNW